MTLTKEREAEIREWAKTYSDRSVVPELLAALDECRAKFDAMSLIADDHAMARVHLSKQRDALLICMREMEKLIPADRVYHFRKWLADAGVEL